MKNLTAEEAFHLMLGTVTLGLGIVAIIIGIIIPQPNNQLLIFMTGSGILFIGISIYLYCLTYKESKRKS